MSSGRVGPIGQVKLLLRLIDKVGTNRKVGTKTKRGRASIPANWRTDNSFSFKTLIIKQLKQLLKKNDRVVHGRPLKAQLVDRCVAAFRKSDNTVIFDLPNVEPRTITSELTKC